MSDPSDSAAEAPSREAVAPPAQPPPGLPPAFPRSASVVLRRATLLVLCLLLVALVVVVVVLPDLVADRVVEREPPAPAVVAPVPPPPEDARRIARAKREAGDKLGAALRLQTELEAEGVSAWGGPDYDAVLDTLAAGDADLQAERFESASRHYDRVVAGLEALRASKPARLAAALETGAAALAGSDGAAAREAFGIALAIAPDHAQARAGMARARVVEEVAALVAAGTDLEGRGELDAALERFASAMALDPDSPQARAARDGVATRIRDRDFRAAMSAALTALDGGDFAAAGAALARAEAVRAGTPEVVDVRQRLRRAVERRRIEDHRRAAARLEAEERWRQAGEHYAAALAIDPGAAFARAGRERSLAKARMHGELDGFLGEPRRLSAPGPQARAERLLAAAGTPDPASEPRLADKTARLAAALERARTPMPVTLRSDNLTEVTVYKVGRFGRFERRELSLPPGRYVAVGTRAGYRDVRVEFTLVAGEEPPDVVVLCRERI